MGQGNPQAAGSRFEELIGEAERELEPAPAVLLEPHPGRTDAAERRRQAHRADGGDREAPDRDGRDMSVQAITWALDYRGAQRHREGDPAGPGELRQRVRDQLAVAADARGPDGAGRAHGATRARSALEARGADPAHPAPPRQRQPAVRHDPAAGASKGGNRRRRDCSSDEEEPDDPGLRRRAGDGDNRHRLCRLTTGHAVPHPPAQCAALDPSLILKDSAPNGRRRIPISPASRSPVPGSTHGTRVRSPSPPRRSTAGFGPAAT